MIFGEDYDLKFDIDSVNGRFTPDMQEIHTAENLLKYFDPTIVKIKQKAYRQYLGYIKKGRKFVLIHVMKYRSKKKFNVDFANWKNEFSIVLTDPQYTMSFLYKVDLAEKTIGFY